MTRIFISHAWAEASEYRKFVSLLNRCLGDQWSNVSVPQDEAIDIVRDEMRRRESEVNWLQEELWRGEVQLRDPKLPDALSRVVCRNGKLDELETVAYISNKIVSIRTKLSSLGYGNTMPAELGVEDRETLKLQHVQHVEDRETLLQLVQHVEDRETLERRHVQQKLLSRYVTSYPALSGAIRNRIEGANIVFLLLTPMILPDRWIYHEFWLSKNLGLPVVGVRLSTTPPLRDLEILLTTTIDYDEPHIVETIRNCCNVKP